MRTLSQNLETLTNAIPKIQLMDNNSDAWAREFWDAFYDIYLATLQSSTNEQAADINQTVKQTLKQTAPNLEPLIGYLGFIQSSRIEHKLHSTWHHEEWFTVCRYRSALQAFNELYGPLMTDPLPMEEDDECDEEIRQRSKSEGTTSKDSKLFPESHWWWHLN